MLPTQASPGLQDSPCWRTTPVPMSVSMVLPSSDSETDVQPLASGTVTVLAATMTLFASAVTVMVSEWPLG